MAEKNFFDIVGVYIKDGFLYMYHIEDKNGDKPKAEKINQLRKMVHLTILHNVTVINDGFKINFSGEDMNKKFMVFCSYNWCITLL